MVYTCTLKAGVFCLHGNIEGRGLGSDGVFLFRDTYSAQRHGLLFLLVKNAGKLNLVIGQVLNTQVQHQLGMFILCSPRNCSQGDIRIPTWLFSLTDTNVPETPQRHLTVKSEIGCLGRAKVAVSRKCLSCGYILPGQSTVSCNTLSCTFPWQDYSPQGNTDTW